MPIVPSPLLIFAMISFVSLRVLLALLIVLARFDFANESVISAIFFNAAARDSLLFLMLVVMDSIFEIILCNLLLSDESILSRLPDASSRFFNVFDNEVKPA